MLIKSKCISWMSHVLSDNWLQIFEFKFRLFWVGNLRWFYLFIFLKIYSIYNQNVRVSFVQLKDTPLVVFLHSVD